MPDTETKLRLKWDRHGDSREWSADINERMLVLSVWRHDDGIHRYAISWQDGLQGARHENVHTTSEVQAQIACESAAYQILKDALASFGE